MAINSHDDYEKLAKLLYPSIEASGNVYYGQTRKLTLDEVFNKNDKGFHAHIESLKKEGSSEYNTYFCWELGPFNGIVKVPTVLPSVPMCFAKYEIIISKSAVQNDLNSGCYDSYEYDAHVEFRDIIITRGKSPIDDEDWDGANFYVDYSNPQKYLYIALKDQFEIDELAQELVDIPEYIDEVNATLRINAANEVPIKVTLQLNGTLSNTNVYQYAKHDAGLIPVSVTWSTLNVNTPVEVEAGKAFRLRFDPTKTKSQQSTSNYLHLSISKVNSTDDDPSVYLFGDFRSLQEDKAVVKDSELYAFLSENQFITDAQNCKLYSNTVLNYGYARLFRNCAYLENGPKILYNTLGRSCFSSTFENCYELNHINDLPAYTVIETDDWFNKNTDYLFDKMFKECRQLKAAPNIGKCLTAATYYGKYREMFSGCVSLEIAPAMLYADLVYTTNNDYDGQLQECFSKTFYGCEKLKLAPAFICKSISPRGMFDYAFYNCKSLVTPPRLVINDNSTAHGSYAASAFNNTFENCTSLRYAPPITTAIPNINVPPQAAVTKDLYKEMFKGCSALSKIYIYSEIKATLTEDNLYDWVNGVAANGDFYYDKLSEYPITRRGDNGIPTNWVVHNIYAEFDDGLNDFKNLHSQECLITSGADSVTNGRGLLVDDMASSGNMELSFDEHGNHQMNTYNSDGSFNQEVWGYKSFNSPVQFVNGIYLNNSSIVSDYDTCTLMGRPLSRKYEAYSENIRSNRSDSDNVNANTARVATLSCDISSQNGVFPWSEPRYFADVACLMAGECHPAVDLFSPAKSETNCAYVYAKATAEPSNTAGIYTSGAYEYTDETISTSETYRGISRLQCDPRLLDTGSHISYSTESIPDKISKSTLFACYTNKLHEHHDASPLTGKSINDSSEARVSSDHEYTYILGNNRLTMEQSSGLSIESGITSLSTYDETNELCLVTSKSSLYSELADARKVSVDIDNSLSGYARLNYTNSDNTSTSTVSTVLLDSTLDSASGGLLQPSVLIKSSSSENNDGVVTNYSSYIDVNSKAGIYTFGNILPVNSQHNIGANTRRYNNIYANNLYGEIPYLGGRSSSAFDVDDGTINYSALHVYSANENQGDMIIKAGSIVTIADNCDLYIDDVKQEDMSAYLYTTRVENDLTTGATVLKQGDAYGTVLGESGISFTPLCDITLKFAAGNPTTGEFGDDGNNRGVYIPPSVDNDAFNRFEVNEKLAHEFDRIEREETIHNAMEIGEAHKLKGLVDDILGKGAQKVAQDYIDQIKGDNDILTPGIAYTDPIKDLSVTGIAADRITRGKITFQRLNTEDLTNSPNLVSALAKINGTLNEDLTQAEMQEISDFTMNNVNSTLVNSMNDALSRVGVSARVSNLNLER